VPRSTLVDRGCPRHPSRRNASRYRPAETVARLKSVTWSRRHEGLTLPLHRSTVLRCSRSDHHRWLERIDTPFSVTSSQRHSHSRLAVSKPGVRDRDCTEPKLANANDSIEGSDGQRATSVLFDATCPRWSVCLAASTLDPAFGRPDVDPIPVERTQCPPRVAITFVELPL